MTYLEKAKQYAKEKWPNDEIAEGWLHFDLMDFARWLDSQQKSEIKKKIEELELPLGQIWDEFMPSFNKMIFDKLNQLIKAHNENL